MKLSDFKKVKLADGFLINLCGGGTKILGSSDPDRVGKYDISPGGPITPEDPDWNTPPDEV